MRCRLANDFSFSFPSFCRLNSLESLFCSSVFFLLLFHLDCEGHDYHMLLQSQAPAFENWRQGMLRRLTNNPCCPIRDISLPRLCNSCTVVSSRERPLTYTWCAGLFFPFLQDGVESTKKIDCQVEQKGVLLNAVVH